MAEDKDARCAQMKNGWFLLPRPDGGGGPEALADRIRRVQADLADLDRFYSVSISPTRHERLQRYLDEELQSLTAVEFDALGQPDRVDYILLRRFLQRRARQLRAEHDGYRELEPLLPFADAIVGLCERRQSVQPMDAERTAQQLDDIRAAVGRVRRAVEEDRLKVSKTNAYKAARVIGELRRHLAEFFGFYASYDPLFDWWATKPYRDADAALEQFQPLVERRLAGVRDDGAGDIVGEPIGREAVLEELEAELVAYSPEELIRLAIDEYRWGERQMKQAARELGCGDDWKRALELVKTQSEPPGAQPALIRELAREAAGFVRDRGLVTVPPLAPETERMVMLSAEQQRVSPYFLGGPLMQVAYPTAAMAPGLKRAVMRSGNRHFARATVLHELIPGHRLQLFMATRHRAHRRLFETAFAVEGWATYWELVLWARGDFFVAPADRVGTLFWRMHRCARVVLALRFHLGQLDAREVVDKLVAWVGHERAAAEAEVRRWLGGDYAPLYQLGYLVGALQLTELRREVLEGGRAASEREFHDAVLRLGPVPIELMRAELLGAELEPGYRARWRFYRGASGQ